MFTCDSFPLIGDEYALIVENGGEYVDYYGDIIPTYDLIFVRSEKSINSGENYNGSNIVDVYTDFEELEDYDLADGVPWHDYREMISNVVFEDEIRPISTSYWFSDFGHFEYNNVTLEISNLNTSNVTDMSSMFAYANISTTDLDLSGWDVSNVIDMNNMFYSTAWKSLNLSWGDKTQNVTDMSSMFHMEETPIKGPKPIGIENWDVSSVINMSSMFGFVNYHMDLSNWNVSSVEDMSCMFCDASELKYIGDLSNWDVSNVINMEGMFASTPSLTSVGNISHWEVYNVENMSYMFNGSGLNKTLDLSHWNVSNVEYYDEFTNNDVIIPPRWYTN